MKLKFGLKFWSTNTDLIDQAIQLIDEKTFDYIELFVVPDTKIDPFKIDVPYIIHIPHHKFGVNIGESRLKKYNLEKIYESIIWADKLDAKYLILHAGHGSMESAVDILGEVIDNRLLIENMPKVGLNDEKMIGYSPEQIEELICVNNAGLCLDFGHAVKAAASLRLDYKKYVREFMELEPRVFHVSDGTLSEEKDEHLSIGDGEYDFGFLMDYVEKSGSDMVTLETQQRGNSLDKEIEDLYTLNNMSR